MPVSDFDPVFDAAGREWNVDPNLLRAMAAQESSGNPRAVSRAGAQGLMQIMPATQRYLGVTDPNDPTQSAFGAAKYMSEALDAEKSPEDALRYYHGGKDWRDAYGPESRGYVPGVTAQYQRLTKGGAQAVPAQATKAAAVADDPFTKALNAPETAAPAAAASDPFTRALNAPDTASAAEPAAAPAATDAGGVLRNVGAGAADASKGLIDAVTAPGGTLGNIAATGIVAAHDALWPLFGGERFPDDVRHLLLDDQGASIGGKAIGPVDVAANNWLEQGARLATGGAVMGAAGGIPGAVAGATSGIGSGVGSALAPEWLKPAAGVAGALVGGAAAAPVMMGVNALKGGAKALLPGGPEYDARLAEWNALVPVKASERGGQAPAAPAEPSPGISGPTSSPGAVGADITTAPIPEKTPAQRIADLEKSVQQTAEERAGPQLRDATPYVEGIPPRVRASSEFTPANALDHKVAIAADPAYRAEVEATTRERNNGMVDLLRSDASDENGLIRAHDYRDEVKPGPLGVFDEQKPVDASGLVDTINGLLRGQDGKQAAVRNTLKSVLDSLHDQDGNIETLPSMLYGARKNLTDLLKKGVKGVGDMADDVRASKPILMGLLPDFDKTISEGAPKFSTEYLPQFHERSLPIDQMEFLQKYQTGAKKITDGDGYLQPNKVQKMLDDVLQGLKAPGVNAAKSLTDQQIQAIINVRNELFADKLRDRMASVRGSDSFQQINRAITPTDTPAKAALKGAAVWGAHGAMMATPAAGWGNALMGGYQAIVRPAVKAAQERKAAEAIAARKNYLLTPLPPENP